MTLIEQFPHLAELMNNPEAEFSFKDCYTVKNPEGAMAPEDVAAALILSLGNYNLAARMLGRSRNSIYYYCLRSPEVMKIRDEVFESALDDVEHSHLKDALKGDSTVRKFFLTTLAKKRGYSTQIQHTGKDDENLIPEAPNETEVARRAAFAVAIALQNAKKAESSDKQTERTENGESDARAE